MLPRWDHPGVRPCNANENQLFDWMTKKWRAIVLNERVFTNQSLGFLRTVSSLVPRPHFPISKLTVSESYDTYITRSFQVTREILAECKALGKEHCWSFLSWIQTVNSIFLLCSLKGDAMKVKLLPTWHAQFRSYFLLCANVLQAES